MQEVTIRLRFLRDCLGAAQRRKQRGQFSTTVFQMPRDPRERIMFLPTWWGRIVEYAAIVANRGQGLVRKINWDPIVDGRPCHIRRTVVPASQDPRGRKRYALHEGFRAGTIIGINAVIPDGLTIEDLEELLTLAGRYRGISPFRSEEECYGTFEVISICRTVRSKRKAPPETNTPSTGSTKIELGDRPW